MRRDHHALCLWTIAATLSLFLSGYFEPMVGAQTVSGCLTKRGQIKRIDRPCRKNQQAVVLPLAESPEQLREDIEELAGRRHEILFHATIHPGEEAWLTGWIETGFVAQVVGPVSAQTENAVVAPQAPYDVRLKLVNMGDTDVIYDAGSGGVLKPKEAIEFAQWDIDNTLAIGHPDKALVTAYIPETRAHLQLDISKMMLIAEPEEDAVILVGAVRAIDPENFGVTPRPISIQ